MSGNKTALCLLLLALLSSACTNASGSPPAPPVKQASATAELLPPAFAQTATPAPSASLASPRTTIRPTIKPAPTQPQLTFTDTPAPTVIPLEDWPVDKETYVLEARLPANTQWIQIGFQIVANDPQRTTFNLARFSNQSGSVSHPVQASPDGSSIAYILCGDCLVIDQLDKLERSIIRYAPIQGNPPWLSAPQFSPDSKHLVYTAIVSSSTTWGVKQVDLSTGTEEIIPIDESAYHQIAPALRVELPIWPNTLSLAAQEGSLSSRGPGPAWAFMEGGSYLSRMQEVEAAHC